MTKPPGAALDQLIARWRVRAAEKRRESEIAFKNRAFPQELGADRAAIWLHRCADELEAVLRAAPEANARARALFELELVAYALLGFDKKTQFILRPDAKSCAEHIIAMVHESRSQAAALEPLSLVGLHRVVENGPDRG